MIKLFTLKDLSAFASDTVFKIVLKLEKYGFNEENAITFESYDEFFEAALDSMQNGENVILAVENNDYNDAKRDLIAKLILQENSCPKIAETIAINAGDDLAEIDMTAHCVVPVGCTNHMTVDGLYTGFTSNVLNGRLTFLPLDFSRIDGILDSLIKDVFEKTEEEPQEQNNDQSGEVATYDFTASVSKMVYSLSQLDKTLSLATGEAIMWVYGLYDRISGLTEVVNFVEVIDEELEQDQEPEPESESSMIVRHAREAMYNTDSDFGACISDVYALEDEVGNTEYFAFVAACDRVSAKVKKIKTNNADDLGILLSHCVVMMCETICQKADTISMSLSKVYDVQDDNENELEEGDVDIRDMPKKKLYTLAACFALAILIPVIATIFIATKEPALPVTVPPESTPVYTTEPTTTPSQPTTVFPGVTGVTDATDVNATTNANNSLLPAEPGATDVSAETTTQMISSESGTFTFYVFGYGHGAGLSQIGAEYYAKDGWNYAQILAQYYYGATLVAGDTYPEQITYAGTKYKTRDYLASSLESEMGSGFSKEALKAQAVALYTFAKYYNFDVSKTGNAYGKTASALAYSVVDEIMKDGLYIAYNGGTALTPFHAISAGKTTSYYNVWGGTDVPYLIGGRSSFGDTKANDFQTTYTISSEDFKKKALESLGIELSGDPSQWITIVTHDAAVREDIGYVSSIQVGNKVISGNDFRSSVLDGKIRSHCFALTYKPDSN